MTHCIFRAISILIDKCLLWWHFKQKGHTNSLHRNSLKPLQRKSLQKMGILDASVPVCIPVVVLTFYRSELYNRVEYNRRKIGVNCGVFHGKTHLIGLTLGWAFIIKVLLFLLLVIIAIIVCCVNSCKERD